MNGRRAPSARTRRRVWWGLLVPIAVVAFVVGIGWIAHSETPGVEASEDEPLPVSWFVPEYADGYTVRRQYIGRVEARQSSRLGFEIGGMVRDVRVEEGDSVVSGALLATLDTQRLEARRVELEASVAEAKAELRLAELTLARVERVRLRDAATEREYDEATSGEAAARAALARAEAALASLRVDLGKSELRSPFDAVVAERAVDAGRVVSAGEPVLRLLEAGPPRVRVGLGGSAAGTLSVGDAFDVDAAARTLPGTVVAVLPTRDRVARGVDVLIGLDAAIGGGPDEVREGDLARVTLTHEVKTTGFWVPRSALTQSVRGLWAVFVLEDRTDHATAIRRADVEVVHAEADRAFVRSTVAPTVRVVAEGLHRLAPGMVIRPNEVPWTEVGNVADGGAS